MTATTSVRRIDPSRSGISPWKAFRAKPEDWFDEEEIAKAKRYVGPLRKVHAYRIALNVVADVAVIRLHVMPNLLHHLGWHSLFLEVTAVMLALSLIGIVENTGFSWWESMVYDKKWGFSTMTTGTFFSDLAKNFLIGAVLNIAIASLLWWVIRSTDAWWLVGWFVISLFSVGFALLAPKLIFPLFNKYTPLADEELHADILSVARGVGADIKVVEVEDSSKRDTRKNAYVAGAGKTRKMVLFDTMLEWPKDQVRWVCAHEIGHWRRKHIFRLVPAVLALQLVSFGALKLVIENHSVLNFAGVTTLHDPGAIPLFFFLFAIPGLVAGLFVSYVQRAAERDADLFGLEAIPEPDAAMQAMRNLYTESLGDLAPSLWKRLNHSHPPVAERLAMIQEWGRRNQAA